MLQRFVVKDWIMDKIQERALMLHFRILYRRPNAEGKICFMVLNTFLNKYIESWRAEQTCNFMLVT